MNFSWNTNRFAAAALAALLIPLVAAAALPTDTSLVFGISPHASPQVSAAHVAVVSNFVLTPGFSGRFAVFNAENGHILTATNIPALRYDSSPARLSYSLAVAAALRGLGGQTEAGPTPSIGLMAFFKSACASAPDSTNSTVIVWGDPRLVPHNKSFTMLPNRVPSRANLACSAYESPYGLKGETGAFHNAKVYIITPPESEWTTSDRHRMAAITFWKAYVHAGGGTLCGLGSDEANILAAARTGAMTALPPDAPYDTGAGVGMVAIDETTAAAESRAGDPKPPTQPSAVGGDSEAAAANNLPEAAPRQVPFTSPRDPATAAPPSSLGDAPATDLGRATDAAKQAGPERAAAAVPQGPALLPTITEVTVTDRSGRPVPGLQIRDFTVRFDGADHPVEEVTPIVVYRIRYSSPAGASGVLTAMPDGQYVIRPARRDGPVGN